MKAYLIMTCAIFGLIMLAHVWRMIAESSALATDLWFLVLTVLAAALCVWGGSLLRRAPRP